LTIAVPDEMEKCKTPNDTQKGGDVPSLGMARNMCAVVASANGAAPRFLMYSAALSPFGVGMAKKGSSQNVRFTIPTS
jgi:hypothetical protein